jgi:RNA polymerase sigma-70 factor (ECF subfamily)
LSLTNYDIPSLLVLCKQQNNFAQLEIYNRYQKAMFNTSIRIVKDSAIAEDVMQESFLTAFTKLDSFKGTATFGSWLKRIVINNSISVYHKSQRYSHVSEEDIPHTVSDFDGIDSEDYSAVQSKQLIDAMQSLKENYRQILTLHYIEGYDYEELTEILNISNANCRTQLFRAKESLRKKIKL